MPKFACSVQNFVFVIHFEKFPKNSKKIPKTQGFCKNLSQKTQFSAFPKFCYPEYGHKKNNCSVETGNRLTSFTS